jgi:hypothetical protein
MAVSDEVRKVPSPSQTEVTQVTSPPLNAGIRELAAETARQPQRFAASAPPAAHDPSTEHGVFEVVHTTKYSFDETENAVERTPDRKRPTFSPSSIVHEAARTPPAPLQPIDLTIGKIEVIVEGEARTPLRAYRPPEPHPARQSASRPTAGRLNRQYLDR